jgi:hypothetical protein
MEPKMGLLPTNLPHNQPPEAMRRSFLAQADQSTKHTWGLSCLAAEIFIGIRRVGRPRNTLGDSRASAERGPGEEPPDAHDPPNARTTPALRAEIARSRERSGVLAERYGVSTETIRKWRQRGPEDCRDRSRRPRRLPPKAAAGTTVGRL